MVTVTGLTSERMIEIENASIVGANLDGDDLVLTTHGGTDINVGSVKGPQGDPIDLAAMQILASAPNGFAILDVTGKLTASQIPNISVIDYLGTSANQAAMLAKSGQKGDWTIRTDLGTVFLITGTDPTNVADWTSLGYPTAPVLSVAGKTGVVTLVKGDVGLGNVDNTSDVNKPVSTAQAAADTAVLAAVAALALTEAAKNGGYIICRWDATADAWALWTGTAYVVGTVPTSSALIRRYLSKQEVIATAPYHYNDEDEWSSHPSQVV